MTTYRLLLMTLAGLCLSATAFSQSNCLDTGYWIGAAQDDITGPIVETGMMGYGDLNQIDEGIHMRLRSRALVVSDVCNKTHIALVIADLGQVFGGVKTAVIKKLETELPGVFSNRNVIISATHTHSGPSGFAHHALYNITTLGFNPQNFNAIVDGITSSILKGYRNQKAATLSITEGRLSGAQWNRSPEAYGRNTDVAEYDGNTDETMLLLKAIDSKGKPFASFNWFAVHGVSIPLENKLVSGDNKGLASYLFEKQLGASYLNEGEFVAGFVQSNSGDISSYDTKAPDANTSDGWKRNDESARAQFEKAYELFQGPGENLSGPVQYIHKFATLAGRSVAARFTNDGPQLTCNAVLGVSFAAGTENGNPAGLFKEGTVFGANWPDITLLPDEQKCHAEKAMLLPVGFAKPEPWVAPIAPFQIVRIGELAIIAMPFEITTMAGRRLRDAMLETLKRSGVHYVAMSALANEYSHYVTTREEYTRQDYEGGSNLHGPWSLAAYTQIYDELANAMIDQRAVHDEAEPADLKNQQLTIKPGVIFDTAPWGQHFGSVRTQPNAIYKRRAKISVEFWGAHPNNRRAPSYMTVERLEKGSWVTVRHDWDDDTVFRWQRQSVAHSIVTAVWSTRADTDTGVYRICTTGFSKSVFQNVQPYSGCSTSFVLQ